MPNKYRVSLWAFISAAAFLLNSCKGPTGPEGSTGSPGISGMQIAQVQGTVQPVSSGTSNGILSLRVECPVGTKAIAGGFAALGDGSQFVSAFQSYPISPTAWEISVHNGYVGPINVTAFATCAIVQ